MPRQNRVTPTGEIIAHPARGLFMGNRGCLHDDAGNLLRTHASQKSWIICVLEYGDVRRQLMCPNRYTELFFLDEAVGLAAGHRPCAQCRRPAYNNFLSAWVRAFGGERPNAPAVDAVLASDRWDKEARKQVTHEARLGEVPDGVFVAVPGGGPSLRLSGGLHPYRYDKYGPATALDPDARVDVLMPRVTVEVLRAGYRPVIHPSAQ